MRFVAALLALAALPGCGGGGTPSAPTGEVQAPPVATSLDFTIIPAVGNGTVVEFRWSGSSASSYRLEIGSSPGTSDVATFNTTGSTASFPWTGVPIGTFHARVRGLQGGTPGAPSNEVRVDSIDPRQVIDALLFASGALAHASNLGRGYLFGRMLGWQPGTGFMVILGESVPATFAAAVDKTVQQIGPATGGAVVAGVQGRGPDPLPSPGPGEVTISLVSTQELYAQCSCENCLGCARTFYSGAFARRAQILTSSASSLSTVAHELGHVIGLAHIISTVGVRPPFTMGVTSDGLYSTGRLDTLDPATIRMLETVYGAGLTAGSTRGQFEAAGLLLPEGAAAASPTGSGLASRGYRIRQEGTETLVLKPFCQ